MSHFTSAKNHFAKAKSLINSDDPDELRFCALELRLSIECLVYHKYLVFLEQISERNKREWQPRKLMQKILQAASYVEDEIIIESISGKIKEKKFHYRSIKLDEIKRNYDALGYFLHSSIKKDMELDVKKTREKLNKIYNVLIYAINSDVRTINIERNIFSDCSRCNKPMKLNIYKFSNLKKYSCINCDAPYNIIVEDEIFDDQLIINFDPALHVENCNLLGCPGQIIVWQDQVQDGFEARCPICNSNFKFGLKLSRIQK